MGNQTSSRTSDDKKSRGDYLASKGCFDYCSIFTGHEDMVRCLVALNPTTVASGADDGMIIVWDIEKRVAKLKINTTAHDADSDSDEETLYKQKRRSIKALLPMVELDVLVSCVTNDPTATLWSLINGSKLAVLKGKHKGPIHCLAPVPDAEHLLVTAGADASICLWTAGPAANSSQVPQDRVTRLLHTQNVYNSGDASPLSMAETSCMGAVRRADYKQGAALKSDIDFLVALDSSTLVTVSTASCHLYVYTLPPLPKKHKEVNTKNDKHGHDESARITQLVGLPSRRYLISADDKGKVVVWHWGGGTNIVPARTFSTGKWFKAKSDTSYGPQAIRALACSERHAAFAIGIGKHFAILPLPESAPGPDGKHKPDSPEPLSKAAFAHELSITQIRWLPNSCGQLMVTASEDGNVKVWDVFKSEQRRVVREDAKAKHTSSAAPQNTSFAEKDTRPRGYAVKKLGSNLRPWSMFRGGSKTRSESIRLEDGPSTPLNDATPSSAASPRNTGAKLAGTASNSDPGIVAAALVVGDHCFRPFRANIEAKDLCAQLYGHTAKVTGLATIPGVATGFLSCGSDNNVILWSMGSYFDLRTMEAARLRLHDYRGSDWPVWSSALKYTMSCDEDCEWLSRGCELERVRLAAALETEPQDAAFAPRTDRLNTLTMFGSLAELSSEPVLSGTPVLVGGQAPAHDNESPPVDSFAGAARERSDLFDDSFPRSIARSNDSKRPVSLAADVGARFGEGVTSPQPTGGRFLESPVRDPTNGTDESRLNRSALLGSFGLDREASLLFPDGMSPLQQMD
ncbi:hypothetical protein DIPPA_32323 [Diplonema papillatum]|nr:hypothetical protein DIPPA_32323 [Diplonema papillatum]